MPQMMPDDWTSPQFLTAAWTISLITIGAICLVYVLMKRQRWHGLPSPGTRSWRIGWLDIGILFCMLFVWSVLAGSLSAKMMPMGENPAAEMDVWKAALDGFLLQSGMALIFLFFWLSQPFARRPAFNTEPLQNGAASRKALLFFLAFCPVRQLLEISWMGVISQLGKLGIKVPMDEQTVVSYFDGKAPAMAFIAMLLLAGVLAPIVEELVFRAGLYRFLRGKMSKNAAIVCSSAIFALMHGNVLAFPTLMLVGITLCLAYESTGSIKVPILFHAIFNLNSILLITLQSL